MLIPELSVGLPVYNYYTNIIWEIVFIVYLHNNFRLFTNFFVYNSEMSLIRCDLSFSIHFLFNFLFNLKI